MTISSSLNAGVSGLNANATQLATISDNIANSSTYGYKRSETEFHSMVISGSSGYSAGGVHTSTARMIGENGPLISTSNSTDIAVSGSGMIPVTDASAVNSGGPTPMYLMTTGSFYPDEDGYLTTSTGKVLMGWPTEADGTVAAFARDTSDGLEPVQIDGNQFAGDPTTQISLGVNLPATETEAGAPGDPRELSVEYFDNLGTSETLSVSFTPTVPASGSSNEWTMVITDSASGGAVVGEYTLTFDDSRANGGTLASVTAVTGGTYDSVEGTIELTVAGGPLEVDIGMLGDPFGMTQLSDSFAPTSITKNGSPVGNLTSVEIDENGFVHAIYDTGFTNTIYQVPLVDVPNPNGLTTLSGQVYQVSLDSGPFFLWDAGDGPTGSVIGYALEESATDVAAELTQLIQTQRAYSSNAKIIQTVDEMLQETTNIKR
ncbi:flagellar hook protein FlgE [Actibacterium sp. XHP0104]|uniref:flagellar hook protein FlgE n=1 Tax=Actibacterium sp. XHP0104 TaxID=2984335 RepID=UPI0021E7142C|nr:flagellar hook-basal body complex protein [Actibacterium sp. XHP0104]MCV2881825.1 flagellar hook-basal body complex protein [Actibacterium sp. XHP0104]